MKRDIKFRGRKPNGEWVVGNLIITPNGYTYIYRYEKGYLTSHTVEKDTVGQYVTTIPNTTQEIFEGDLFNSENKLEGSCELYYDDYGMPMFRTKEGVTFGFTLDMCAYKVVGNIHDNPNWAETNKVEEYKIGEEFQVGKHKVKCVEEDEDANSFCKGCFFIGIGDCTELKRIIGDCCSGKRKDGKDVSYRKIN